MGLIRHGLRTISRMPGLAAVVILSLGVGIGVNTAVFSWIQAIILTPIPGVDDSGRFYHVEAKSDTGTYPGISWLEYRDLAAKLRIFGSIHFAHASGADGSKDMVWSDVVAGFHCPPASFILRASAGQYSEDRISGQ